MLGPLSGDFRAWDLWALLQCPKIVDQNLFFSTFTPGPLRRHLPSMLDAEFHARLGRRLQRLDGAAGIFPTSDGRLSSCWATNHGHRNCEFSHEKWWISIEIVDFPIEKWCFSIEIVNFPMKNGGSFHSYVNVYRRVLILLDVTNDTIDTIAGWWLAHPSEKY